MTTTSNMSRSLYKNRDLENLEPYEGKLSCTVLRGGKRVVMPLTYPIAHLISSSATVELFAKATR